MKINTSKLILSIKDRLTLLPSLARLAPAIIIFIAILCSLINPSAASIYIVICIIACSLVNHMLKFIMKLLFGLSKSGSFPLLGCGNRPAGASNCGLTLNGGSSKTFGMPSGHAQGTWFIVIYLILITVDLLQVNLDKYNSSKNYKDLVYVILNIFGILLLAGIGIYVSYSRVYVEGCHTIQQVIIGGIIGGVLGFLAHYFKGYFTDKYND
jgi:membrane-associated phospholipid phosphatase